MAQGGPEPRSVWINSETQGPLQATQAGAQGTRLTPLSLASLDGPRHIILLSWGVVSRADARWLCRRICVVRVLVGRGLVLPHVLPPTSPLSPHPPTSLRMNKMGCAGLGGGRPWLSLSALAAFPCSGCGGTKFVSLLRFRPRSRCPTRQARALSRGPSAFLRDGQSISGPKNPV